MKHVLQYPSLRFLETRIKSLSVGSDFFSPAFPGSGCNLIWPSSYVIDVVLFGDALRVLLDCDRWPRHHMYRLWVLNSSHRTALMKAFQMSEESIGIIPRDALVRKSGTEKNFPPKKDSLNFIFSGRPIGSKNLKLVSMVVQELQHKGMSACLHVFGYGAEREYEKFIPLDGWMNVPVIHGNKGERWTSVITKNPIYINLALEATDDFCVSCAEAEEKNWPLIVPDRGPYREIRKSNHILIPGSLITSQDAQGIAELILKKWDIRKGNRKSNPELLVPEEFSYEYLAHAFRRQSPMTKLIRKTFVEGIPSLSHDKLLNLLEDL